MSRELQLDTFVLVDKNNVVVSPLLTTTRVYGNWLESIFDSSVCGLSLYMKSIKRDGERTLEKHPGTRIGVFFDTKEFNSEKLKSWFIPQESAVMDRLVKLKFAEKKDAIPISVNDKEGRRMIRLYSTEQVELYVKMTLDKSFKIADYVPIPKQVKVNDSELQEIIKPEISKAKRRLF